ncbi:HNH endonuclease signature motif containing protein [Algicola sagamiensis]|uniref:HNH endonuclease signature motif containing protein n=1 Tax=Algicola sagamiensis TaxID=163869 RepID=UPI00036DAD00|nr:HNH endonuclease signature motif containing protein [Algicola sagamiensis]
MRYTQEQLDFLQKEYRKLCVDELTIKFNAQFGLDKTDAQIRSTLKNHKIRSGRTGRFMTGHQPWVAGKKGLLKANSGTFQKGNIPKNKKPVGSERVSVDGYREVKVAEPNHWDLKHRVVWRQHHGDISSRDLVRFKDGDRLNCDIENLFLVSHCENAYLYHHNYNAHPLQTKETVILLAKMDAKVRQTQKESDHAE